MEGLAGVVASPDFWRLRGRTEERHESPSDFSETDFNVKVEVEVAAEFVKPVGGLTTQDVVDYAGVDFASYGQGAGHIFVDLRGPEVQLSFGLSGPVGGAIVGAAAGVTLAAVGVPTTGTSVSVRGRDSEGGFRHFREGGHETEEGREGLTNVSV